MGESDRLLSALKRLLRQRGIRYADLARALDLSEPSIKRMFASGRVELRRLERICEVLDLDFFELARMARGMADARGQLSLRQETALAEDPQLLVVFHLACNQWAVADMRAEFGLDEAAMVRLLARLDRLQLIELLPGNRIRLRISRDFMWRHDGPVLARHKQGAIREFLRGGFEGRDAVLNLEVKELGDVSIATLARKLERLAAEFQQHAEIDASLPSERRRSVGMLVALRPWVFSLLDSLRGGPAPPVSGAAGAGDASRTTTGR